MTILSLRSMLLACLCFVVLHPVQALSSRTSSGDNLYGRTSRNVATQILQGTGNPLVDLNEYNLDSLNDIASEWTVNWVQKAAEQDTTLRLGCQSEHLFVDSLTVEYPRLVGAGLGLELTELASRPDDAVGIVMVSGLVEEGAAAASNVDVLPGDCISKVSVIRQSQKELTESQDIVSVPTLCLNYDATVEAISQLPPCDPKKFQSETFRLELKRIRRRPKVQVRLQYPPSQEEKDETIEMFSGENLRQGMLTRGVKLNDELAKRFDTKSGGNCGAGGLCRTCAVSVLEGGDLLNPQRVAESQMLKDEPRWRLACKAIVGYGMKEGELVIRVNPRQWD